MAAQSYQRTVSAPGSTGGPGTHGARPGHTGGGQGSPGARRRFRDGGAPGPGRAAPGPGARQAWRAALAVIASLRCSARPGRMES
ncbi:hypothetical protein E4K10_23370 [Streptomyces sp. T1317-0309]|nr:hypothetical protein E4K10_23370 [Streptomyces sp. T1317-0309]